MRGEREYINQMKEKIIEAINNNEFEKYLMGENNYIVQSRELPYIEPGTGNLYNFMMAAICQLQNNNQQEVNLGLILLNGIEQLIYKNVHGLLNAVEIIRSILKSGKENIDLLGIKSADLKDLTEKIRNEAYKLNQQLKETKSNLNSSMSIYDCLEFYNDYMYENVGIKLL